MITEGGAAPNVVPDRTVADFYIRYPDEVYLAQLSKMVDDAARAAALATGTKVKIDHYGKDRDGIGVGALNEVAFALHEEVRRHGRRARAGETAGLRGDRQRVERDSRHRLQREDVERAEPHLRDGAGRARRGRTSGLHRSTRRRWPRCCSTSRRAPDYRADGEARVRDDPRRCTPSIVEALKKTYVVPKVPEP